MYEIKIKHMKYKMHDLDKNAWIKNKNNALIFEFMYINKIHIYQPKQNGPLVKMSKYQNAKKLLHD